MASNEDTGSVSAAVIDDSSADSNKCKKRHLSKAAVSKLFCQKRTKIPKFLLLLNYNVSFCFVFNLPNHEHITEHLNEKKQSSSISLGEESVKSQQSSKVKVLQVCLVIRQKPTVHALL